MSNPLKKTMVFLGLAEEELEEQSSAQQAPAAPRAAAQAAPAAKPEPSRPAPQRAAVTPLRRVTPTKQPVAQPLNEILTVHPTEYRDAKILAESFREGVPVIINLSRMAEGDAKRLIDFASGLTMGLHGRIERVTSKVFLLSPEHIETAGEDSHQNDSGSFFVPPTA
ncbi:cell division protein SepF [Leucobacter luti]|uniref:Cell division protein SepF n=1 Tax=Leucobacter luti TaxID=340320 RepID=A0A4Q7TKP1_9MICO|nr:cell division protein SepF [Leucobacter luti]MBL3700115.1 cell division protein SepF [Leucobacter luti]RZT61165.1 cell division inhibitor SepF [Leucobacter luti]